MKLTRNVSGVLDIIRGCSAQVVFIGHLLALYGFYPTHSGQFNLQAFGVILFFLISGFLISYSVWNKPASYTYQEFIIDRFSRIYIAYLPALVVVFLIDTASYKLTGISNYADFHGLKSFVGNALMLQDFPLLRVFHRFVSKDLFVTTFGSDLALWTVSIEWWLYLFFGFIYFKRIKRNNFLLFLFLLIIPVCFIGGRENGLTLMWFAGVLVYRLFSNRTLAVKTNSGLLSVVFAFATIVRLASGNFLVQDFGFITLLACTFYFMLVHAQNSTKDLFRPSGAVAKWVAATASYSFSLYLLHFPIIVFFMNFKLGINKWVEMAGIFAIGNVAAWLFAKNTEALHLKLRSFLKKKLSAFNLAPQIADHAAMSKEPAIKLAAASSAKQLPQAIPELSRYAEEQMVSRN